jgi:hypothetical protein
MLVPLRKHTFEPPRPVTEMVFLYLLLNCYSTNIRRKGPFLSKLHLDLLIIHYVHYV